MRIRLKDHPHLLRLMSQADQARYGPGLHPADDSHPPAKTDALERDEQRQFANWCLLHDLPFDWHTTHKRSGASVGSPDFTVGAHGKIYWIEFKRDYDAQLSQEQEDFKRRCEKEGIPYYIVYSAREAIRRIERVDLDSLL